MKKELYCPTCGKDSVMQAKPFEWSKGVIAEGFQCANCREFLLTLDQHKKAAKAYGQHNTLSLTRKLFTLGQSLAVRIPYDIVNQLKLKPSQKVQFHTTREGLVVKPA